MPPQPASAPAGDPPAAAPAAAPAAGGDDSRIANLEREQQQQRQLLEKIAAGMSAGPAAGPAAGETPPPASLAEQVRKEIADADQRRRLEEDEKTWRAGVTEAVENLKKERAPREPEQGIRATVQRFLFGKPD